MTTVVQLSENSHQGFDGLKPALCLASMKAKSNPASGMPLCLRRNGIESRSSGKEWAAETELDVQGSIIVPKPPPGKLSYSDANTTYVAKPDL